MASDDETMIDDIVIPGVDRSTLPNHVALRTAAGGIVILVGTAHLSEESASDVSTVIRAIKPNQVLIELCPARLGIINPEHINELYLESRKRLEALSNPEEDANTDAQPAPVEPVGEEDQRATQRRVTRDEDPINEEAAEQPVNAETPNATQSNADKPDEKASSAPQNQGQSRLKSIGSTLNKPGGILAFAISYMYESISSQVKLSVGEDMRTAAEEAAKLGVPIALGDRPIGITIARAWGGLSTWEKIKLGFELCKVSFSNIKAEDIESLKNQDILTELITELSKQYPTLHTHLLAERDLYLAARLRTLAGPVVVGVVGLGHVAGIKKNWNKEINLEALSTQPPASSWKFFFFKVALGMTALCGSFAVLLYYTLFKKSAP